MSVLDALQSEEEARRGGDEAPPLLPAVSYGLVVLRVKVSVLL